MVPFSGIVNPCPPPFPNGRAQAVRGPAAAVALSPCGGRGLRREVLSWGLGCRSCSRPERLPWGCWRSAEFIPGCLRPWHPPRAAGCSGRRMPRLVPMCHSRWCWRCVQRDALASPVAGKGVPQRARSAEGRSTELVCSVLNKVKRLARSVFRVW